MAKVINKTMAIIELEDIMIYFAVTSCVPILKSFLSIHGPLGIISLSHEIFVFSFSTRLSSNTESLRVLFELEGIKFYS